MTEAPWGCPTCTTTNDAGADRCVVCTAERPAGADPAVPLVPVVVVERQAPSPAALPGAGASANSSTAWPSPDADGPPEQRARGWLVPVLVGTAAVLVVLAAVGVLVLRPDDPERMADRSVTTLPSSPRFARASIETIAGSGEKSAAGNGGPAREAGFQSPIGVAVDAEGAVYVADRDAAQVRRIDPTTGTIDIVGGTGSPDGPVGDGGPATEATMRPRSVAVDADGNVFVADELHHTVRRIDAVTGMVTTVAGSGTDGSSGDGGPATEADVSPAGIAVDPDGALYIVERVGRVRHVDPWTGRIRTLAGDGTAGFAGDGGPATQATFDTPDAIAVDPRNGNVYISDLRNFRIRMIDAATGTIDTMAGNGLEAYSGDGGPASDAEVSEVFGLVVLPTGELVLADSGNNRIRIVDTDGTIRTIAGTTSFDRFAGDGGSAVEASLYEPLGVAVAPDGSLVVADTFNLRVRRIAS